MSISLIKNNFFLSIFFWLTKFLFLIVGYFYFKNFFLAEYSDDHYELYKNTEILFRSSEELLSRVKFWLNKPDNFLDETAQTLYKNVAELDRSIFSETQNIITKIGI